MSLTDVNGGGLSAADVAAVTGNNSGFGGNGDGAWWLLVLFLFAMGGWNNGFGNGYGGGGAGFVNADVQRGFDQSAVMAGISGINSSLTSGFADAALSQCNQSMNLITALNGVQGQLGNMITQNEMARQQCCCDTKQAIADLKYTVATENCQDRTVLNDGLRDIIANQTAGIQTILDKMCQQELDAERRENANLRTQLNLANLAASQNNQTSQILADNAAQTAALRQMISPTPVPAYTVPMPFRFNGNMNYGCGCATV